MFSSMVGLDPSKLSPQVLAKMTALVRELPYDQIMAMQTLMQKSMAGQDVTAEMQAMESKLPAGFREKLARIMYEAHGVNVDPKLDAIEVRPEPKKPESVKEARMMILDGVANGAMSTEQAYSVLFEAAE